jgi:hypothetical protein
MGKGKKVGMAGMKPKAMTKPPQPKTVSAHAMKAPIPKKTSKPFTGRKAK